MRKITSLLLLLCAFVGTAWAQISVGSVYSIQNKTSKKAISQDANLELAVVTANTADNAQLWIAEEGSSEGTYKLRNLASGAYAQYVAATYTHWYTDYVATDFYIGEMSTASGDTPAYYYISRSAVANAATAQYTAMHESGGYVVQWEQTNDNSQWSFVAVEDIDVESAQGEWTKMTQVKALATSNVQSLLKLTIFSAPTAATEIEAISADNTNVEQLKTAADAINTIVLTAMKSADGKSVIFNNKATDVRANLSPTAHYSNNVYGTSSEGDEIIWTIKSQENGSFKLYNFITNKYMPEPGVADLKNEAEAAAYTFIVTDDNTAALVSNGKMLHQANYWSPEYSMLSWWDINNAASLWDITQVEIKADAELYRNATSAATALPYTIQQTYGLVTEASYYYSNYKSEAEGSYEALLDNNSETFFHSAYGNEPGDGSGVHYIQADLGEGKFVDQFYFYMAPRTQNSNNRPANITVSGSNDNSTFTEIAQITTTLDGSNTPYLSDKLGTAGTNYRYIRLTITSTNSGTKFFTLSELYFYPANTEVDNLAATYQTFATTSITSSEINAAAEAMVNTTTALAIANLKKEIAELLANNENNHAATPALGQYTTAGYNALKAAYESSEATQESLEAAIAAFNQAKNVPVYFITSAWFTGNAIYYDGAWKYKTANKYDRQMWMTISNYTEENVPAVDAYDASGTFYSLCDYLTGTLMNGLNRQIVAVDGWKEGAETAYSLQGGANDAYQSIHASGNNIVHWLPAQANDCQASAWQVEYIGNSYDLDQMTDEQLNNLMALNAAYAASQNVVFGTEIGLYSDNGHSQAQTAAQAILAKAPAATLSDDVPAAIAALNNSSTLNTPEQGKFYRLKNTVSSNYMSGNEADITVLADGASAASTIFYLGENNTLLSYNSGKYLDCLAKAYTAIGSAAHAGEFAAAYNGATANVLTYKNNGYWTFGNVADGSNIDRGSNNSDAGYNWTIEEVTTLPVAVSSAGYATLYSPVALDVPTGVTAYTGTVNDDVLQLTAVEGTIPANTGVILVAKEGTYDFTLSSSDATGSSALEGKIATIVKPEGNIFTLQNLDNGIGLYPYTGTELKGFRAYLTLAEDAAVNGLRFEDVTGIENALIQSNGNAVIFDLSGRRVAKMQKGLYIVNGKKVLVK